MEEVIKKLEQANKLQLEAIELLKKTEVKPEAASDGPEIKVNIPPQKNQKLLVYPGAITSGLRMRAGGSYSRNYPLGAVVHFTAGRSLKGDEDALNTANSGARAGHLYFVISATGRVIQSFNLNEWGSHAGASAWPGLGTSLSQHLVGIEICCAGHLGNDNTSWFGETYASHQIRKSVVGENIVQAGNYHKYTVEQEKSLIELLVWLKHNNPGVFKYEFVLGHDEIATPKGRKNDPGGSLSMTMPQLRQMLFKYYS